MYKQVRNFNPSKMGTKKGYCLQNCRIAFDPEIPPKYPDAKEAMLANRNAGTLHSMDSLPLNCAVPVFADTPSEYEHVMVCDRGVMYSDGYIVNSSNFNYFGWGETLNDVRIVEYVPDPEPAPAPTPAPEPKDEIKVGDLVDLIEPVDYYGTWLIKDLCKNCTVRQIVGDRVVVNSYDGDVLGAVNINNLKKV